MTANPSIVLLLLQLLGLRSSSEESKLVPCIIGYSNPNPEEDDESTTETEFLYGCTVAVEKAHFVPFVLFIHYRMSPPIASVLCLCVRDVASSNQSACRSTTPSLGRWNC